MMDQEDRDILLRGVVVAAGAVGAVFVLAATAGLAVSIFRLFGGL